MEEDFVLNLIIDNRYKIIRELGQGGMSVVYLAEDTLKDNMNFAIKTVRQNIIECHRSTGIDTFKNEYEIMTRLKHPNLTRVYDFGLDRDNYYIVMEYLKGDLLSELKASDERTKIDYLVQILRALEYIHSRNIIYRDIKPGNIMIIENKVKLMDFGVSGHIHTQDKKLKGTLSYIPPEALKGNISFATDIFSLGVVFYELITGNRFYGSGNGSLSSIVNLLSDPSEFEVFHKKSLKLVKNLPLRKILNKLTAYNIDNRYRKCSDIISDINSTMGLNYEYETKETKYSYLLGNSFADRNVEINILKSKVKNHHNVKMVIYSGPNGIGKTRLFNEFKKYCRLNQVPFFEISCTEGETQNYNSICAVLSQLITFSSSRLVKKHGKYLKMLLPKDKRLFDSTPPEIFNNPKILNDIIVMNITDYIIEFCIEHKGSEIIIYFNDLQWIDSGSELILKNLLCRLDMFREEDFSILLYANINENRFDKDSSIMNIMSKDGVEIYDLQALDIQGINEYIENIFGSAFLHESLKYSTVDIKNRVGGNPLFLQEMIRSLIEKNIIIKDINCWKLLKPVNEVDIPDNLIDIVRNRLSKLYENENKRRILRILSMVRIGLNIGAIKAIIDKIALVNTAKVLLELETLEIIQSVNIENHVYYSYSSSIVKDIVKSDIKNKEEISLFLANIFESVSGPESEEYIEEIAYHYKEAKEIKKAVYYYEKSGDRAKHNYFNDKAVKLYETALLMVHDNQTEFVEKEIGIKLKIASILFLEGNWDRSGNIYKDCIKLSKNIKNKRLLAESNIGYGLLKLNRGKPKEALTLFEESLKLSEETENIKGLMNSSEQIGHTYSHLCDYQQALQYFEKCENLAYETDDKKALGKISQNIGNIYYSINQYQRALEYFQKAKSIADEIGDKIEIGQAAGDIGNIYLCLGEYYKALKFYNIYRKISEEIGYKQGKGKAAGNEGVIYYTLGKYQKALECSKTAKKISEEIGYKKGTARALGNMGNIYKDYKDYSKSLESYKASRQIFEEIQDKWGVGASNANMGLIYDRMEQYDDSLECFEIARNIAKEIGFIHGFGVATGSMGSIYFSTGQYQKALECFNTKKSIAEELGDKRGLGIAEANSGLVYHAIGNFKNALECFLKYWSISEEIGHKTGAQTAFNYISEIYMDLDNYKKALEYNEKAVQIAKQSEGIIKDYFEILLKKAIILRKLHNFEEAGLIIKELESLADQINEATYFTKTKIQSHLLFLTKNKNSPSKDILDIMSLETNKELKATVYYELFLIYNDLNYCSKSKELFEELHQKEPRNLFKKRIDELNNYSK